MVNAGLGAAHVNKLLSGLEIPTISARTLHMRELEVGDNFLAVANATCATALNQEKAADELRSDDAAVSW